MTKQTIGILALGGSAYKIVNGLSKLKLDASVTPPFTVLYVDTSETENTYLLEGSTPHVIDTGTGFTGSGGNRSANLAPIKQQLPGIIANYLATNPDIKIVNVVFSSGGGSGSTLAFVAIQQLINEGITVACYISNTPNSLHRAINAVASITSLNNMAIKHNTVLPVIVYDTTIYNTFVESDTLLLQDMVCTASMLHIDNIGVDDGDRKTVLNPMLGVRDVTAPGVKFMQIFYGYGYTPTHPVLSVLTYCVNGSNDDIGSSAINMFSGVLNEGLKDTYVPDKDAISLLLTEGRLNEWVSKTNLTVDKYKKVASAAYVGVDIKMTTAVLSSTDDDGFTS